VKRVGAHLLDDPVPLLTAALVGAGVAARADSSTRAAALTLGVLAAGCLVFRRRAPVVTLAASGGLVIALFAVDHSAGPIAVIAPAIALYSIALWRGGVQLVAALVAAAAAVMVVDLFLSGHDTDRLTLQTAAHVALVALPVLAAEVLRNRRAYIRVLHERLELAERTREEEAARRAQQERLRIARELHDVTAHTLTTINVQAGVAAHLLDRDLEHAREALATIESASHEALDELRMILGVLRAPENGDAPREPLPGLAAVGSLIDQARGSGLPVTVEVEGEQPTRVPEAVQLAAFRILQESLTNARRHAPGAAARVNLSYEPDRLQLAIENDAAPGHANGSRGGVGILGMRERAVALGGTLEARRAGDRFRVVAELPYTRTA
jgi:signal transduction histidine kinase